MAGHPEHSEGSLTLLFVRLSSQRSALFFHRETRSHRGSRQDSPFSKEPSKYQKAFKQGATIVPISLYFVRIPDLDGKIDPDKVYWAETDPAQAEEAKKPYKDVRVDGLVEGRFIYSSALARHLLPFVVLEPATVVLPYELKNHLLYVRNPEALRNLGYREFAKWMVKAETIWHEKRGGKAAKQTLYQRLDYQRELTRQDLSQRHLVIYNAAGTNVSASRFDRQAYPLRLIVEYKLYWIAVADEDEVS